MLLCMCVCEIVVNANTRKVELIQKKLNKKYNDFDNIFNWKKLHNIIGLRRTLAFFKKIQALDWQNLKLV